MGAIKLPGKPQGFIVEQKGKRIFANIPALKQIAVMDREARALLEPWSLTGAQGNYPIDLDEDRHRLFVGCRQPARMIVIDTASGKPVASIDISGDTDDLFYDPHHINLTAARRFSLVEAFAILLLSLTSCLGSVVVLVRDPE